MAPAIKLHIWHRMTLTEGSTSERWAVKGVRATCCSCVLPNTLSPLNTVQNLTRYPFGAIERLLPADQHFWQTQGLSCVLWEIPCAVLSNSPGPKPLLPNGSGLFLSQPIKEGTLMPRDPKYFPPMPCDHVKCCGVQQALRQRLALTTLTGPLSEVEAKANGTGKLNGYL